MCSGTAQYDCNQLMFMRRCRAAVGDLVKALFGAIGQPNVDRLARYATEWLAGQDSRLQRTAAQVREGGELVSMYSIDVRGL